MEDVPLCKTTYNICDVKAILSNPDKHFKIFVDFSRFNSEANTSGAIEQQFSIPYSDSEICNACSKCIKDCQSETTAHGSGHLVQISLTK